MKKEYRVPREILIYAFRYALGRQSTAPYNVTETLKENIENISTQDIKLYIREIEECECYGMDFDKEHWMNFVECLKKEIEKR